MCRKQLAPDIFTYSLLLTVVKERCGADLSDAAFQLEAERSAGGVHAGRNSSVVLQLHSVEVWGTALRTRTSRNILHYYKPECFAKLCLFLHPHTAAEELLYYLVCFNLVFIVFLPSLLPVCFYRLCFKCLHVLYLWNTLWLLFL